MGSVALRPQKQSGYLGREAQDGHLDFHTAPEVLRWGWGRGSSVYLTLHWKLSIPDATLETQYT